MSHEGGVDALRVAPVLDLPLPEAIPLREASINPVLWGFDGNSQTDRDLGILSLDEREHPLSPILLHPFSTPASLKLVGLDASSLKPSFDGRCRIRRV